jgi:putative ABC transport system permease protein
LIVLERKNDIAILRAIGWPDEDILAQVVVEALIIAVAGGILGCLAGGLLVSLVPWKSVVSMQTPIEPLLAPVWLLISLIMSALTGLIAGWFPVRQVLAQVPAQMLQRR